MINGYSIPNGEKYFARDGSQNYLVFQALLKCFGAAKTKEKPLVMAWKSKRLPEESIKPHVRSNNSLNPKLDYFNYH